MEPTAVRRVGRIEVFEMAKVRHKAKTTRSGAKKPAVKTAKAKSKRAAPKDSRKRVVAKPASATLPEAPAATIAQPPVAVTARREPQVLPLFWPALAVMRIWLGPRAPERTR
jgi:hypothetical protein